MNVNRPKTVKCVCSQHLYNPWPGAAEDIPRQASPGPEPQGAWPGAAGGHATECMPPGQEPQA